MRAQSAHQTLAGKVVLITGGARRIGAALARGLHADGASVIVHYRGSQQAAAALCGELNHRRPDSAHSLQADLLRDGEPASLTESAAAHFGGLDILINNASSFYPTPVGEIDEAAWRDLMGSNLKAPAFLSQAAAPLLKARHGTIVNMVDIHARRPLAGHPVYSVAKAGLAALTLSLARELAPEVRVNGIAPGPILWPESGTGEEQQAQILAETCLGRAGDPDDIVDCARYLISAGFVTGQIIAVDGGRSIGW